MQTSTAPSQPPPPKTLPLRRRFTRLQRRQIAALGLMDERTIAAWEIDPKSVRESSAVRIEGAVRVLGF